VVELGLLDRRRQRVTQGQVEDLAVLGAEEQRLVRSGLLGRVAVGLQVVQVTVLVVPAVVVVVDPARGDDEVVVDLA
jgi:hypothetical protein